MSSLAISGSVSAETNESTELLVIFEDPSPDLLASSEKPHEILQTHANQSLSPLDEKANRSPGITIEERFWIVPGAIVSVDNSTDSIETIEALPNVTHVDSSIEPFALERAHTGSFSSAEKTTYGLEKLAIPEAWRAFETTGQGSTITILDTGVDGNHDAITVTGWKDFSDNPSSDPIDYGDHGTHVAGIAAGTPHADRAAVGVAPNSTLNVGAVATDCESQCTAFLETVIAGIEWGVESQSDVISISLGRETYASPFINVTRNANAAGSVVVASSGNNGEGTSSSPANVYDVLAVGAVDTSGDVWSGSSGETINRDSAWGDTAPRDWPKSYVVPDIVAPGVSVESALPGNEYGTKTGTSMAAPHVAGTVALIQSATTERHSPASIRTALTETANHPENQVSPDSRYGYGIVDPISAIEALRSPTTVEGIVTAEGFNGPIEGATVSVHAGERHIIDTNTRSDGTFRLEDVPSRSDLVLVVSKPGYIETSTDLQGKPNETISIESVLEGNASITVKPVDSGTRTPVADTQISIERPTGELVNLTSTSGDVEMEFSLPGTGEPYTLTVTRNGFKPTEKVITVEDSEESTIQVELSGDGTLEIYTLDAIFDEPVTNANVTLSSERGTYFVDQTDDQTHLGKMLPSDVTYTLNVDADGYLTETASDLSVESDTITDQIVSLSGDATLDIAARDAQTGASLSSIELSIARPDGVTTTIGSQTTDTDDLSFQIPGTDTEYQLTLSSPGYDPITTRKTVGSGEEHPISISLHGDTTVDVSLRGALFAEPITAQTITIENNRGNYEGVQTGPGSYRFKQVPGDIPYTLRISADGYAEYTHEESAPESVDLPLNLDGSATLDIRVETLDGATIEGATITIESDTGEKHSYRQPTDESGSQSISLHGTDQRYTVHATADGYENATTTTDPISDGTTEQLTVQLTADDTLTGFGAIGGIAALLLASAMARRKLG